MQIQVSISKSTINLSIVRRLSLKLEFGVGLY